jgi:dipeptidyl aminopeptidase/acylaminoacyl peptidase
LRYENDGTRKPIIIICHGFTAHKDWGPFPCIGRRFAQSSFASLVFNFSHNGIGGESGRFTEPEKFSRNTVGKELEDIRGVVDAVTAGRVGEAVCDSSRIGILGHSRGGGLAILSASNDERLRAVAAWSSVATFLRYTVHQAMVWRVKGYMPITIRSTRTKLRQSVEVLRDLEANREAYDVLKAVTRLKVPLLLIHGKEDLVVKPLEAEHLFEASDQTRTELVLVDRAGHMFGVRVPFREAPEKLEYVMERTVEWLRRHLGGG